MNKMTILCVDDERNVLLTLRNQLMRYFPNYAIEIAESGEEALTLVEDLLSNGIEIPLVIADQIMPNMQGDQVLIELHTRHPEILKVMLTGQASAEAIANVVNRGNLYRFISKPWNEVDLKLTVTEAVRSYEQEKKIAQQQVSLHQANDQLELLNADLENLVLQRNSQVYSLLNNIPHIAWLKDRDGRFLAVNESFAQACGYDSSQLVGLTDLDVWDQELAETYRSDDFEVMRSGKQKRVEEKLITSDGSPQWIETFKAPVFGDRNEPIGTAGIAMDISDRKQSELTLQSLMEGTASVTGADFFFCLAEKIAIALDVSHICISKKVGERLETLAVYYDQQFQPNVIYEIANTPCAEVIKQGIYYCLKGVQGCFPLDEFLVQIESESYMGLAIKNEFNETIGVINILSRKSIANPKRAEILLKIFAARAGAELERLQTLESLQQLNSSLEMRVQERTQALQESRNMLQLVLDTIPQRVFWKDLQSRFLGCNPAFANDYQLTDDQIIGKTDFELPWSEWASLYRADDAIVMETKIPKLDYEQPTSDLNGEQTWIRSSKIPLTNTQGEVIGVLGCYDDISDRKRSEQQLQSERLRLQLALEVMEMGTWESNLDTGIWSAKTESIFGYETGTFSGDREAFLKLVYLEDQERVFQSLYHSFTTQSPYNIEYRINRNNDGEIRWVAVNGKVVENEDGNGLRIVGVARDITDRKQAEIVLRQYKRMVEIAPVGMALVDQDYTYRLVNQTYLQHNERQLEEIVGQSIQDIMGNDTFQNLVRPRFDRCLAGETIDYGDWFYFKKAGNRFVSATYSPYFEVDGTITGVVISNRDVTERREAEISLQDSEERLRLALTAANQGLYDLNPQSGATVVSPEYATMLGYSPEELQESRSKWIERLHPDDLATVTKTYRDYVNRKLHHYKVEFRHRTKNGDWKWILSLGKIVEWDDSGQPLRMLGTHTDISDRKRAELELDQLLQELSQLNSKLEKANHQLEDYSQTLEQRVQERTNELNSAQERIIAQEKLASLGTLTAGIAHEMRNPLNFVKNYAEGSIDLSRELLEILRPIFSSQEPQTASSIETLIIDLQENASTIHRHSLRAAEIIDSMMQHSRCEPASMQPTRLNNLLDEAVKLACHSKRVQDINFNVSIHTNYDPEVDLVNVISNTLMRAFINLIDNAYDAMRSKEMQLNVDDTQPSTYIPSLTVSTQLVGEKVEICIRDNGCGLAPQIQSKILDPFFTTKPPGAGTGLGLSLTHDIIVKQHQGTLVINSELNEFTEILIAIPLHLPNIQSFALK
ncbi:circadian input kinase A [Pseudanabaena sp. lw0831]|uniref:PAS domain S-box protein n=1 Tax=Pseudanabaena sp. lw0831 TaxID=1357935 RepID=UPI00191686A0|nr:PAS domain S-box protein [Pseudanabaena sp. lw0831]GBO54403.1 circadian input kinase A [Pseudanabaena sp. lw0831]